jgi:hypothetical protein
VLFKREKIFGTTLAGTCCVQIPIYDNGYDNGFDNGYFLGAGGGMYIYILLLIKK